MSLYIWRWQEQIFWYGSLIYILEKAYFYTKDIKYKFFQDKVISYVYWYLNNDWSLPLVFNKDNVKWEFDGNNISFKWWYYYNNYYDYLPFFLYYIRKTLKTYTKYKWNYKNNYDFSNEEFFLTENSNYITVLSRPKWSITNDIPISLIFDKNKNSLNTPFYWWEEFWSKFYSNKSIPLPYFKPSTASLFKFFKFKDIVYYILWNILSKESYKYFFFRKDLDYKLDWSDLVWENNLFKHKRSFVLSEEKILVKDTINFKVNLKFNFFSDVQIFWWDFKKILLNKIYFGDYLIKLTNNLILYEHNEVFCNALWELKLFYSKKENVSYKKGQKIYNEFEIILWK